MRKWIILALALIGLGCIAWAVFGYILPYAWERDAMSAQNETLADSYHRAAEAQSAPDATDAAAPPAAATAAPVTEAPAAPAASGTAETPVPDEGETPSPVPAGQPAPNADGGTGPSVPRTDETQTSDPAVLQARTGTEQEDQADELPLAERPWEWQPEQPSAEEVKARMLPQHVELYARNPAYVGWLTAAGAQVDLPVVQTPEENGRYLYRDFDGNDNKNGTLILDGACDLFGPSQNLIIYGHNMRSGLMFGELDRYTDPAVCRANPLIVFDTLTQSRTYVIVAVLRSTQIEGGGYGSFAYAVDFADAEETAAWIAAFERKRLFDPGVDNGPEDRFLTLSTCSYHEDNGRLIVIARELREGETAADFTAP